MKNDTLNLFINHLCSFLPDRTPGKRGTKPIPKYVLAIELFKLFKTNCGWRNIEHSSTCRNYLNEMQRRGNFKKYFNSLVKGYTKYRPQKSIVDSSDIVSYDTNGLVAFNGKYHNYVIKFTLEITEDCLPIYARLDKGSGSDSLILDKYIEDKVKLPYELYLDKGYERYERRRELKECNCQVHMEMKQYVKSRKHGPKFSFTDDHKHTRGLIEKVNAWIKSFNALILSRIRIKSIVQAMFFFCLSYVTFNRLLKL